METKTEGRIIQLLEELEEAFNISFNHTWFRVLAEESPVDKGLLREVEDFFVLKSPFSCDELQISEIVLAIEQIVSIVKRYLLPCLRDRLRISGFFADDTSIDRNTRIKYKFIAYAFPHNIRRLEEISLQLRSALS